MITGNPNMIGVIILWLLLNGLQYFYMRQIGKGAILTAIDIMFLMLTLFFCGIPLLLWTPWRIIWLIDTIIVTNRLRKEPISQWRFF